MHTIGTIGSDWRASVTAGGTLEPWDGEPLSWFVAADDRWHDPTVEPSVRQRRVGGMPVIETRVRVPQGDVVQTIYATADHGGITMIEVTNESTMPVAVAFDRRRVLTERPIVDMAIHGIDLPDTAFVSPLGHKATLRIGVPHGAAAPGPIPANMPTPTQVVNGWSTLIGKASRFELPDGEPGATSFERATSERCELLLTGLADPSDEPAEFIVGVAESVRMGERVAPWLDDVAVAVAGVARRPGWDADVALAAARRLLVGAGEDRAVGDLDRIVAGRGPSAPRPEVAPQGVLATSWLDTLWVDDRGRLFPDGIPAAWFGQSFDAYGLPVGPATALSLAVRWHGPRPAVLWEQLGDPVTLTAPTVAPDWATGEAAGEALWPSPPSPH